MPPLERFRYIHPPTSVEPGTAAGNGGLLDVGVFDASGRNVEMPGGVGEINPGAAASPTAFSCSSNRTSSMIVRAEFDVGTGGAGAVEQSVPDPILDPIPSRQIWKVVLKPPVPPWIQRAAKVFGSGCRRSMVRLAIDAAPNPVYRS